MPPASCSAQLSGAAGGLCLCLRKLRASFAPAAAREFWLHLLITAAIVALVGLNVLAAPLVVRSENLFSALKMLLLGGFLLAGLFAPMDWSRLAPGHMVSPLGLIAGAMLIFATTRVLELIANASGDIADRRRFLPIAYIGGVLLVILIYVLIVVVVIGHLDFAEVSRASDTAPSVAGRAILGEAGYPAIAAAALLATTSAINATF